MVTCPSGPGLDSQNMYQHVTGFCSGHLSKWFRLDSKNMYHYVAGYCSGHLSKWSGFGFPEHVSASDRVL